MLDISLGTLGLATGILHRHPDMLGERGQFSESIGFHVVHEHVQRVRHTLSVIYPEFKTVISDVELGYKTVCRETFNPHRVDLRICCHERNVSRAWLCPDFVYNHLLARFLTEHDHLVLCLALHTVKRVLHIIFLQFRKVVGSHDDRTYNAVIECNTVIVRIIDIIGTLILHSIKPVQCICDIAHCEEAPVISFHSRIRPVLEHCRV